MTEVDVKKLVLTIVKPLVTNPDEVYVNSRQDDRVLYLDLNVAPEDVSRIIGKHGRVVQAIRSVLHSVRLENKFRLRLNIVE